jgi:hypothetical protein
LAVPTETILRLLENGKWHYLKDIERETCIDRVNVESVTKFLANYNFIELNEVEQKVKIDPPTGRFLKRIRKLENEENCNKPVF